MEHYSDIMRAAEAMEQELRDLRRDLHKYAEPGWLEMRTSALIAEKLSGWGLQVLWGGEATRSESRMGLPDEGELEAHYQWALAQGANPAYLEKTRGGHTGVIGILDCGAGPTVAFRYDIDALYIHESESETHKPRREGFASITPGVMHACGHDGHTAIGLGTAKLASELMDQLHGKIIFLFQPAEEGVRGAKSVVEKGCLDHVDYLIGTHIVPSAACQIWPGMRGGLATTKIDAYFTGEAAHAGIAPHMGKNALLAAASAALSLHAIPRHGEGQSRINVGTLTAGTGRNVICETAKLEIEVRGETAGVNRYMEQSAYRILEGAAAMYGCSCETRLMGSAMPIEISDDFTTMIWETIVSCLGIPVDTPKNTPGSEDFAYMTDRVLSRGGKACFVGIAVPCASNPHTDSYDFDEKGLVMGVQMYAGMLWRLLGKKEPSGYQ